MLSSIEYSELARAYPILNQLHVNLQDLIRQEGSVLKASAGQVLLAGSGPIHNLLLLTTGVARVVKPVRSGRELVLYRLRPGDICCLTALCLLSDSGHTGQLISESEVSGILLTKVIFQQVFEGSLPFRQFVFDRCATRVSGMLNLIEEIITKPLDQRLAFVLIQKDPTIHTTHQMLADEVGTVREVVSRILKDFEARGILALGRRKIWIKDKDALSQIAYPYGDPDH